MNLITPFFRSTVKSRKSNLNSVRLAGTLFNDTGGDWDRRGKNVALKYPGFPWTPLVPLVVPVPSKIQGDINIANTITHERMQSTKTQW